jgi:hypothetical protein
MGGMRNAYKIVVGKLEGRRSLTGSRCRCLAAIKVDLKVVEHDTWTVCVSSGRPLQA